MKKLILSTVALSFIATSGAYAQSYQPRKPQQKHYSHQVQKKHGYEKQHRWKNGQRFDRKRYGHHQLSRNEYRRYRLKEPPHGYHWVRTGDEFILVAAATGIIASIIAATR